MIDSHAHIQLSDFDADRHTVIGRAREGGVARIICIGSNRENSELAVGLAQVHDDIYATVGVHPKDEPGSISPPDLTLWLENILQNSGGKVVAIGECGLDFHSYDLPVDVELVQNIQEPIFRAQLAVAHTYNLPLIFHVNKAYDEALEILQNEKEQGRVYRGVFHFYTGGKKRITKILDLGDYYFGVGGAATYDPGLREVAAAIPLDRILLETDCPYVAPSPHRGERSEPAYVKYVAEMLAGAKGLSVAQVCQATDENTCRLFATMNAS